jgi:hypothetical protein
VTGWWFSLGTPVSSTNKTDRHYTTEILLNVALNTINQTYCYGKFNLFLQDMRSQHNISPLDSSGSTADSYTSDTTLSAGSPSQHSLSTDIADSGNVPYFTDDRSIFFFFNTLASTYRPHRPIQG